MSAKIKATAIAAEGAVGKGTEHYLHVPVMLNEIMGLASSIPSLRLYIDCTLGAGGHTEALLSKYHDLCCIGIDADEEACTRASNRLSMFSDRLVIVNSYFDEALAELARAQDLMQFFAPAINREIRKVFNVRDRITPKASFILFDLGISSYQIGPSGKGFSFTADEPLDMRFSTKSTGTAEQLIATLQESKLADLLYAYGEERYSRRIAHAIVEARKKEHIRTAARLASIVLDSVPPQYRHSRIHPATRTFQALRIAVNDELGRIERALDQALGLLAPGAVCAVISFHSLEDRIVKRRFALKAQEGEFSLEWKKPKTPSDDEICTNRASRSAKLRAIRAQPSFPIDREAIA